MPELAIVAALEREVRGVTKNLKRVIHRHGSRDFTFYECEEMVVICGGMGAEAARRATEAAISLYGPAKVYSVGFAGALRAEIRIGDVIVPEVVIDARDGSRTSALDEGKGILVTFMAVASAQQKASLAQAYGADIVDMEAAAVARAARAHGIAFGAIKAVSDDLNFEFPEMDRFIDPSGQFRAGKFAWFVALRPWLWPGVARLAGNAGKAARALVDRIERLRSDLQESTGKVSTH